MTYEVRINFKGDYINQVDVENEDVARNMVLDWFHEDACGIDVDIADIEVTKVQKMESKRKKEARYPKIYVKDKRSEVVHRVGEDLHDSLILIDGEIRYYNLQGSDGTGKGKDYGYEFVILEKPDEMREYFIDWAYVEEEENE